MQEEPTEAQAGMAAHLWRALQRREHRGVGHHVWAQPSGLHLLKHLEGCPGVSALQGGRGRRAGRRRGQPWEGQALRAVLCRGAATHPLAQAKQLLLPTLHLP